MAFQTSVSLANCEYTYSLHPHVKKFTLRDNTFAESKVGNYELSRLLESVPNSGNGFLLKIIVNKDLNGFSISTGSACTAGAIQASHVLQAMYGKDSNRLHESIRISTSDQTPLQEIQLFVKKLKEILGG